MKAVVFYITISILYSLSIIPLGILYRIFGLFRWFIFYILKYRRKVVRKNLQNAFPDFSPKEINTIEKKFYQHLSDLVAENIWAISASKKQIESRCTFSNMALFDRLYNENKDFIVVMGHLGNWEWSGLSMSINGKHRLEALYRPLKNPYFDRFMKKYRGHFGMHLIPMQMVARNMLQKKTQPTCTTFIADQSAPPDNSFWTTFLSQETGFFTGYETLARKFKMPVAYVEVEKVKRGKYIIHTHLICENAALEAPGAVIQKYAELLEKSIRKQPESWLWSHKRWKHKRPENQILHKV